MTCATKRGYTKQKTAASFAARLRRRHGLPYREYLCEHCGLWHMTNKTEDTSREASTTESV